MFDNVPVPVHGNHICKDCNTKTYVSRQDTWRRGRPKCKGCGSTKLELIKKKEKESA